MPGINADRIAGRIYSTEMVYGRADAELQIRKGPVTWQTMHTVSTWVPTTSKFTVEAKPISWWKKI
jgi:hypothetical protein